jgi:hypothetical protein
MLAYVQNLVKILFVVQDPRLLISFFLKIDGKLWKIVFTPKSFALSSFSIYQ